MLTYRIVFILALRDALFVQRQCQCDKINETEMDEDMQQVSVEAPETFCSENISDVLRDEETVCFLLHVAGSSNF